ncbi:MAG TPA: tetratricopeptide repeat protein, partial [Xanthobacteraceae bacterium]|nr:tetratricopeptide repeat protein [Xanthobacteraceae bacterium]
MKNLDELLHEARRLQQSGRLEEAGDACRELLRRKPNDANVVGLLARIRAGQQRWPEALAQAEKAARIEPGNASFHFQHALALIALDRRTEAREALRRVCKLDLKFPRARSLLAQLSMEACDWRDFDRHEADLVALAPDREAGADPFILLQLSDDPAAHLACARNFIAGALSRFGSAIPAVPFEHSPVESITKIRVGYLSGDFRNHPTTHLIAELIELHDRSQFEVVGLSTGPSDGTPYRERIEKAFDRFVDAVDWQLNEFAQRLAALKLDILVDLSGYTKTSLQPFLSSRPAPVQANYLGYPGTTGADFIDYCIVDSFVVPPAEVGHYSESLVYLPGCYQVSDRKRPVALNAPARADHGLPASGFVFCCLVNAARISPNVFDIWMRLLGAVSGSVLWLLEQSPETSQNLRREAAARRIDGDRLIFAPKLPLAEHLARLPLADLALDTFPYNGHTNTNDLLWMGVPIVTTAGRSFAARAAGSILTAHGF